MARDPGLHVWLSSFVYDSRGRLIQSFEVQAKNEQSLLDGVVSFFRVRWAGTLRPKRLVLDRTAEPGCYIGMLESVDPATASHAVRRMVQVRMRRSHRLADEAEPWWLPDAGPLDGLMPLDVALRTCRASYGRR